jgi:hypothetical protein
MIMKNSFVYIWFDGNCRKFYIGVHKGKPTGAYAHSSSKMQKFSMTNIPDGFRRRILSTGSYSDMALLEAKFLLNREVPINEKYYNCVIHSPRAVNSQRRGIERAKKQGKYTGRQPIHPSIISEALKLLADGISKTEVSKILGIGRATLYRYLNGDGGRKVIDDNILQEEKIRTQQERIEMDARNKEHIRIGDYNAYEI